MAVMLAFLKVPLSWGQIMRRTFKEAFFEDNCLGMAAQLAYYFFFALFPALLMLIAIASYFPYHALVDDLFKALGGFAPPEVLAIITDQLGKIASGQQGGLFTLGMLTTIWSSSAGDDCDHRHAQYRLWHRGGSAMVESSPDRRRADSRRGHVHPDLRSGSSSLARRWPNDWPASSISGPSSNGVGRSCSGRSSSRWSSGAFAIIYYFAPDAEQDWVWLTPGSIFATSLWLLASLGFKYYVATMANYTETYGAIGGVMILMLWFYISGLVILVGAEMNAEIEHASPVRQGGGRKGSRREAQDRSGANACVARASAPGRQATQRRGSQRRRRQFARQRPTEPPRAGRVACSGEQSDRIATPHLATVNRPRINRRRLLRLCDRRGCGDGANAADAAVAQTQADLTSHSGRPAWRIDYCCCCCCCCWSSDCNAGGGGGGAVHVSTGENFVDAGGRSSRDT